MLFALAAAAGGSGYSGTLSTNTSIRKQQLVCDPAEPKQGSTSTLYDPSMVTLTGVMPGPGYNNLGFIGHVEVRLRSGNTLLQPLVAFFQNPLGTETGYVQMQYRLSGSAGQITPPAGYAIVQEDGVQGVDTHAFFFDFKPGVPTTANAAYKIFAANASTFSTNVQDFLVTNDGTNTRLGPESLSPAFVSNNVPPVVTSTGGPYTVAEGSPLTLSGAATDAETPAAGLAYAWDVNGDGVADATGATATVSAATLAALGLNDGPAAATVRLTVSDGDKSTTATTSLNVTNVAPTAGVVATASGLSGASLRLTATDPSAPDAAAGFAFRIDWGDGSPVQTIGRTANNGAAPGTLVNHTYAGPGEFTATVVAVDKDGGAGGAAAQAQFGVAGARIGPDPGYPGKNALLVYGTSGNDVIRFAKAGTGVTVKLGTASLGTFKGGFGRIILRAGAGHDDVQLGFNAAAEVVFFGGAGDDTLIAGNFLSTLVGGDGRDTLSSGNAKDLVIGGDGAYTLRGGDGDDLLVAGATDYDDASDNDVKAVTAILREWVSGSSYANRVAHLTGSLGGGLNGAWLLKPGVTVFDDADADDVKGGNGRDWLLLRRSAGVLDAHDLTSTELGTAI